MTLYGDLSHRKQCWRILEDRFCTLSLLSHVLSQFHWSWLWSKTMWYVNLFEHNQLSLKTKAWVTGSNVKGSWKIDFVPCNFSAMCFPSFIGPDYGPKPSDMIICLSTINCPSKQVWPEGCHVCTDKIHNFRWKTFQNTKKTHRLEFKKNTRANKACFQAVRLDLIWHMGLKNICIIDAIYIHVMCLLWYQVDWHYHGWIPEHYSCSIWVELDNTEIHLVCIGL